MQPQIMVHYNVNGKYSWQDQYSETVPAKGDYVLYRELAYIVVEVWHIFDKHGPHIHGVNVFLEEAPIGDTVLGKSDPDYYGG